MTLLGLTGYKQSGKDTFAQYLVRHAGFARVAFADELKREVAEMMRITVEKLERHKARYRNTLQDYGMRRRREEENHWITLAAAHIDWLEDTYGVQRFVVSDVRFPNEAAWVRARGGKIVRLVRADGLHSNDPHESEAGQDRIEADKTWRCRSPEDVERAARSTAERYGWLRGERRSTAR